MSQTWSFPQQLALVTLSMGLVVGGLTWLGQQSQAPDPAVPSSVLSSTPDQAPPPSEASERAVDHAFGPRDLLPEDAWLIVDFAGPVAGAAPFAGQLPGLCAHIPPPERVGLALLPGDPADPDLRLLLAAPGVSDEFWKCAVAAVESAGGKPVAAVRGYEVLQSPSGLLVRSPEGHLVFGSSIALLPTTLAVLRRALPSAATTGAHRALVDNLLAADPRPTSLVLTVHLPGDWLEAAGPDAGRSPLRHLRAAALVARPDGSAVGAVHCNEPGCRELAQFLDRARRDLLDQLPPELRAGSEQALDARILPGPPGGLGRIALSWSSTSVPLTQVVSALLGGRGLVADPGKIRDPQPASRSDRARDPGQLSRIPQKTAD